MDSYFTQCVVILFQLAFVIFIQKSSWREATTLNFIASQVSMGWESGRDSARSFWLRVACVVQGRQRLELEEEGTGQLGSWGASSLCGLPTLAGLGSLMGRQLPSNQTFYTEFRAHGM